MPELVVIAPERAAVGHRLAGARTLVAGTPPDAAALLEELAGTDHGRGVVAVDGSLWDGLDERTRSRWESCTAPVVVPLPADTETDPSAGRRSALQALLARAVGYEFTFTPEGESR